MPGLKKKNKKKTPLILKLNFFFKALPPNPKCTKSGPQIQPIDEHSGFDHDL